MQREPCRRQYTGARRVEVHRRGDGGRDARRDVQHPARALPGDDRVDVGRSPRRSRPRRRRARPAGGRPQPAPLGARGPDRGRRGGDGRGRPPFVAALSGTPGATWMAATGEEQPDSAAYGIALLSRHPVTAWQVVRLPALPRRRCPCGSAAAAARRWSATSPGRGGRGGRHAERARDRGEHPPVVRALVGRPPAAAAGARAGSAPTPLVLVGDLNMGPRRARVSRLRPLAAPRRSQSTLRASSSTTCWLAAPGERRGAGAARCRCGSPSAVRRPGAPRRA